MATSSTMAAEKFDAVMKALTDPVTKEETIRGLLDNIETWTDESGNQHEIVRIGHMVMPPAIFRDMVKIHPRYARDLMVRDADVFLPTYPKTGTHWINNLIHFMLRKGQLEEIQSTQPFCYEWANPEQLAGFPDPRLLPSHLLASLWANGALRKGSKIVLVFRNPKDTAVSCFKFLQKEKQFGEGLKLSWNYFLDKWMTDAVIYFNYFDYYREWHELMENNKDLDILVVTYEAMHEDGLKEMRRIRDYLDLNHSDEKLQQILDRCSINNLRDDVIKKKLKEVINLKSKTILTDEQGQSILYRKGAVGDWRHHFTVAQSDAMDKLIEEKFNGTIFEQLAKCN